MSRSLIENGKTIPHHDLIPGARALRHEEIADAVAKTLHAQPIIDMHTHLYPPAFGTPVPNASGQTDAQGLLLWGLDELLTYHYLVAEVFRVVPSTKLPYETFWQMSKREQAEHIWKNLFVERTPLSEACRGVVTTLQQLGLDPADDLETLRGWFQEQNPNDYIDRVMEISNVQKITMTNAVFDSNERNRWLQNPAVGSDSRFSGVLRIDPILRNWPQAAEQMASWGYAVSAEINAETISEAKRFLGDWLDRTRSIYMAVSLPPDFRYPCDEGAISCAGERMIQEVVLPLCAEQGLPFAMMIGSSIGVNPALRDAGDMVGRADIMAVVNLCREFPDNKFFVTMLSRENQHELCVAARKFGNLMPFGVWWFLNNPSLMAEIETMRFELLGTSFIPQHSDARVLDQLIYKWHHSREVIEGVLCAQYEKLSRAGWSLQSVHIERDVRLLLRDNFTNFLGAPENQVE